jgi:hypothetical protein
MRLATPRTAIAAGLAGLLLFVAAPPLAHVAHQVSFAALSSNVIIVPAFLVVGVVVAARRPGNPIGWVLLGAGILFAVQTDASLYSIYDYRVRHDNLPLGPLAVLLQPAWAPAIVLFALAIMLFPDGGLPSGRWRLPVGVFFAVALVWLAGAYGIAVGAIASHAVHVDSTGNLLQEDHPSGFWTWFLPLQDAFFLILAVLVLAWVVGQVPVFRSATGIRRQQLKLLLAGGAVAGVGGTLAIAFNTSTGLWHVVGAVGLFGLLALPISLGLGILRYRLFDIDRLISRTLSYALLTGLLVGVFVGLVLLTTRVLPFSSPVGVAASTLAAAGLFSPLRARVQRVVDRRFNRARYDAETTVAAFATRLRGAVDVDTVLNELAAAAGASVEPTHVSVWVKR